MGDAHEYYDPDEKVKWEDVVENIRMLEEMANRITNEAPEFPDVDANWNMMIPLPPWWGLTWKRRLKLWFRGIFGKKIGCGCRGYCRGHMGRWVGDRFVITKATVSPDATLSIEIGDPDDYPDPDVVVEHGIFNPDEGILIDRTVFPCGGWRGKKDDDEDGS
jgi:hypothetical protein